MGATQQKLVVLAGVVGKWAGSKALVTCGRGKGWDISRRSPLSHPATPTEKRGVANATVECQQIGMSPKRMNFSY